MNTLTAPLRRGPARTTAVLGASAAALAGEALLSLVLGGHPTPPADLWTALTGQADGFTSAVVASRVPRTVVGVLVGTALALAETLTQGVTRNPPADPGLLGANAGAAAAVVTATALLARSRPPRPSGGHCPPRSRPASSPTPSAAGAASPRAPCSPERWSPPF